MSADDLADRIKAVIDREVYCIVVVRPEHEQGCPGGGDYCASHCPVPTQDYGETADLARLIAEDLTRITPPGASA